MAEAGFLNGGNKTEVSIPLEVGRFGNSICFGATGSGKTTSYISINLSHTLEHSHGVLLFDFKGNLHLKAKAIAKKQNKLGKVIEVGKPWSSHINLLEYCDSKALEDYVLEFSGSGVDSYWSNSAVALITGVFEIMQINKNIIENLDIECEAIKQISKEYSFRLLHHTVSDIESIKEFLQKQEVLLKKLEDFYRQKESSHSKKLSALYYKQLLNLVESLKSYKAYSKDTNDGSGLSGVIIAANTSLQGLAKDDFLNRSDLDIVKKLEDGFMIIINSSNLNSQILSIIHKGVVSNLLKRAHKDNPRPISIYIDEAHQVLSGSTIPETSVCRENRFEYYLATQDISSLLNTFKNQSVVDELLSNIHQHLEFKAENIKKDPKDGFTYEDVTNKKWGSVTPMFISKDEEIEAEIEFQEINEVKSRFLLNNIEESGYVEYDRFLMSREGKVLFKQAGGDIKEVLFGAKYLLEEAEHEIKNSKIVAESEWIEMDKYDKLNARLETVEYAATRMLDQINSLEKKMIKR